jgi:hypothetical protein
MNLQAKVSQGIPIGPDLSYLFAEVVLAEVDKRLGIGREAGYRWFDDYELSCQTRAEADALLARLKRELARFRLRLNLAKTEIKSLPLAAEDAWRDALLERSKGPLRSDRDILQLFDLAFRLRQAFPNAPVVVYALGILFRIKCPSTTAAAVALSCVSQCLLSDPGVAQKAFALLTYWQMNGLQIDATALVKPVARMIAQHDDAGLSSDVAWALSFCLDWKITLDKRSARRLSVFGDDAVAIQACHLSTAGLLPNGFSLPTLAKAVARFDADGEHWLSAYELVRQGYASNKSVSQHPVLSLMLTKGVPFYRKDLPSYAALLHPGGAPDWAIDAWLRAAGTKEPTKAQRDFVADSPITDQIAGDVAQLAKRKDLSRDQVVAALFSEKDEELLIALANIGEY